MTVAKNARAYLKELPKADLHCHLLGTVRASTFAELARRENLTLPEAPERIYTSVNSKPPDPDLYRNTRIPMAQGPAADEPQHSYSLFEVSGWVRSLLRNAEDLTRITYEAFEAAAQSGTTHLEVSFDMIPQQLQFLGYEAWVDAHVRGIRMAERDFHMTGRLLAAIDRSGTGATAAEWIRTVAAHPHEYVAGIGLDNLETAGPPERFAEAYRVAADAGLGRTAHTSEHVPAAENAVTCLDVLGCQRLDHGYFILEDDAVVERMRRDQTAFTVASTTSRRSWRPWRKASILAMVDAGLNVFPCSDDPALFPTSVLDEYLILAEAGVSLERLTAMARSSLAASWLPEAQKQAALDGFDRKAAALS